MKNNILLKLILAVFAGIAICSCNDDFLNKYPLDEISNETFWNSENDLMVYNNSIYDLVKNDNAVPILMGHHSNFDSYRFGIWYVDEFSDNIAPRHSRHNRYQQVRAGKHNIPSSPEMYGWVDAGWTFLRAINVGMDNYDKADISEDIIDKYKGEARLFRGWFYADKVSKFGDVPWVDHELNIDSEELYGSRTPREEVMTNVLEDINFACEKLPEDWGDGNSPGRLDRWDALLVKSRICLFEGTWRKYHGGSDVNMWLQEAADAAYELMQDGPHTLYTTGDPENDYQAIHKIKSDLSGVPEVMYWRRYELGIFTNHTQGYHKNYSGGATKSFVEDYLCTDGLPISLSPLYQGDENFEDIFVNRDPRLRQTILHPEDVARWEYNNIDTARIYPRLTGLVGGLNIATGYHIIKVYENIAATNSYNTSDTPAIILRFGEALLNYAEAKAELGTISQEDLDISINLLRDRVGMPHMTMDVQMDPRYADDGVSALIVEIRRERRIELFMEGFRYDDLRRWKQGKKLETPDYGIRWDEAYQDKYDPVDENGNRNVTMQSSEIDGIPYIDVYKGTDWENPVFDESKHYLWPIPVSSIAENSNLEQTQGWE